MKTDMKKWMFNLSNSVDRKAMPIITYPGIKLTGRSVTDIVTDCKAQFECIVSLCERYHSVAAMTAMDLSVEAEAFGSRVSFFKSEIPTVVSHIVYDMSSAKQLKIPKVWTGRTGVFLEAAGLAAGTIMDRPTFGGEIGPFSLAGRLMGMTEALTATLLEPEKVHVVLNKATEFLVEYAKAFKKVGANGIIIAEPAAGLLSPEQCDEFSSKYVREIIESVQNDHFMVILHNCGNTRKLIRSIISTGAMGLHLSNAVEMWEVLPQVPWGKIVFGNIDPARVFKNGTAADVRSDTWELLERTASYKNFVLSSGCDIPAGTPLENIDAFFEILDKFNKTVLRAAG